MKKLLSILIALCCICASMPLSACASELNYLDETNIQMLEDCAYAVIEDANGNIIDKLDVDVEIAQISSSRSTGTTYAVTYSAEIKTDSDATEKDGVSATTTITWKDITGPTNLLVKVEGSWSIGTFEITEQYASYTAFNTDGSIYSSDYTNPTGTSFLFEPQACTAYLFQAISRAKIVETGNTISLIVKTSAFTP